MTHLFIINPVAGKYDRTSEVREQAERICREKMIPFRIEVSHNPGDCRRIAREAAQSAEEYRIYACGGDGTLNEVVNGVAGFPNVSVTHFAGGSGNDFVKSFGTIEPFRDLKQLLDCRETEIDLVRCNSDLSVNICSVGFDARIGTEVSKYKRLPLVSGPMAYAISAVVNIIKGISEHYVVEINGEKIDSQIALVCACNGSFYGGGFHPIPEADPCDGMLDVLIVKKVSRLKVARFIGKYKQGRYQELGDLVRHVRTKELTVHCDKDTPINVDGELRMCRDIHIRMTNQKLRFFYPKTLDWEPGKVKESV